MEKYKIPKEIIEPILMTDNNIDKHIENLHEIMITWLFEHSDGFHEDIKFSYRETYESLREFLQHLKPIENIFDTDRKRSDLN